VPLQRKGQAIAQVWCCWRRGYEIAPRASCGAAVSVIGHTEGHRLPWPGRRRLPRCASPLAAQCFEGPRSKYRPPLQQRESVAVRIARPGAWAEGRRQPVLAKPSGARAQRGRFGGPSRLERQLWCPRRCQRRSRSWANGGLDRSLCGSCRPEFARRLPRLATVAQSWQLVQCAVPS